MRVTMSRRLYLGLALFVSLLLAESRAKESPETTQSPAKDKKSAEDIMFGNQQNKPAGMVDDLLTLPERDGATNAKNENNKINERHPDGNRVENKTNTAATKDKNEHVEDGTKSEKVKSASNKEEQPGGSGSLDAQKFDYYDYLQETDDSRLPYPSVEGYHLESIEEQNGKAASPGETGSLPDSQTYNQRELGDYPEEDYDGVLYRRKRTPRRMPTGGSSSFTRKRSIRSNLDDLLAGSGRRALRLKRDVGVEQFLAWLSTLRGGPEQLGLREDDPNEMEIAETEEAPSEIPLSFFYDPKMPGNANDWYNPMPTAEEAEESVFPPGFLESALTPALARELMEEEAQMSQDVIPDWMNTRYPYPVLSRRSQANSAPPSTAKSSFYPLDYRYVLVPGQKKKRDGHHRRMGGINIQDLHESSTEKGKWGQFPVHRRRPLSEDPDPDRLYALASLLAEDTPVPENNGEELDRRRRRAPKA